MAAERICPYPGLRPFRADETDIFFGRETLVTELLAKLGQSRFVAVVGTSGCGKSSLVRTGMVGALETGLLASAGARWRIADMRPGGDPLTRLARALVDPAALGGERGAEVDRDLAVNLLRAELRRGPRALEDLLTETPLPAGTNLLVLVDQFEEIFRYRKEGDIGEADAFVSLLLAAMRSSMPVYVVITMRSDFLGDCALFEGLPEALNRGQFLVPRLTRDQRRLAIERPAQVFGTEIEAGLVNRLLNDMESMRLQVERSPEGGPVPDQLPLMQHVLMRVWQRVEARCQGDGAQPRLLTLADYEAVGGLRNALDRHAEEAYASLATPAQREIARLVFQMLTERGQDRRDIRRPTRLRRVCDTADTDAADVARVVEAFRHPDRSFLTPPAGIELVQDTVLDVSHESLIGQWKRLDAWAAAEAQAAEVYRELAQRARRWDHGDEELLRHATLRRAQAWRRDRTHNAAWAEQYGGGQALVVRFIHASERRARLRVGTFASIGALFAFMLGLIAYVQVSAKAERDALQVRADTEKLQLRQEAVLRTARYEARQDRPLALLLGAEAHTMLPSSQSTSFLAEALGDDLVISKLPVMTRSLVGHKKPVASLALDAQGSHLVSAGTDGRVIRWDLDARDAEGELLSDAAPHTSSSTVLGAGAKLLAAPRRTYGFELRNLATGDSMSPIELAGHTGSLTSVALSPDGRLVATGSVDDTVILWDLATQRPRLHALQGHRGNILALAFSPDGRLLATASSDNTVLLWQVDNGQQFGPPLKGHKDDVMALAFSPDGRLLAGGSRDNTIVLWDVAAGRPARKPLVGHRGDVSSVAFSPDGQTLASGSRDNSVRIWDLSQAAPTGTPLPKGHTGDVTSVAFAADGRLLASGGKDDVVIVWDWQKQREQRRLRHGEDVVALAFGARPHMLLTFGITGTVRWWNTGMSRVRTSAEPIDGRGKALALVGSRLVAVTDRRLEAFDITGAHLDRRQPGMKWRLPRVTALTLDADERFVAMGGSDGSVELWDTQSITRRFMVQAHKQRVTSLAISRDGQWLASGSSDKAIHVWSVADGTRREWKRASETEGAALSGHDGSVLKLAFSPDGSRLASGGSDDRLLLWNMETGQPIQAASSEAPTGQAEVHRGDVIALAFHPDGRMIVSGGKDDRIVFWDSTDGSTLGPALEHLGSDVTELLFDPQGRRLFAGVSDGSIDIWRLTSPAPAPARAADPIAGDANDTNDNRRATGGAAQRLRDGPLATRDGLPLSAHQATGVYVRFDQDGGEVLSLSMAGVHRQPLVQPGLAGHQKPAVAVVFSPDGRWIASGGMDGAVLLWDRTTRRVVQKMRPPDAARGSDATEIYGLAFSPDSRHLAAGTKANQVLVWDVERREPLYAPLAGHSKLVFGVAFSPDGKMLASASFDGTVRLWDVASGVAVGEPLPAQPGGRVWGVAFSPEGDVLASTGTNARVTLWDAKTHHRLRELKGHTKDVVALAFAPAGRVIASAGVDQTIRLWNIDSGEAVATLQGQKESVLSLAISGNGRWLAAGDSRGKITLWNIARREEVGRTIAADRGPIYGLAFSADDTLLASTSLRREVVNLVDLGAIRSATAAMREARRQGGWRHLAADAAAKHVVVADGSQGVRVVDTASGATLNTVAHGTRVRVATVSNDGRYVATGGEDGSIRVWELAATPPQVTALRGHDGPVTQIAFAAGLPLLASGGEGASLILWDVVQGTVIDRFFNGHDGRLTAVAISPSGEWIASGGEDRVVRLRNVGHGPREGLVLGAHENWVSSLAFSDDLTLVSGGLDRAVVVWDLPTQSVVARLEGHDDAVWSVAASADGKRLASAGLDGSILIWDLDRSSWVRRACAAAGRRLTPQERSSYLQGAEGAGACAAGNLAAKKE